MLRRTRQVLRLKTIAFLFFLQEPGGSQQSPEGEGKRENCTAIKKAFRAPSSKLLSPITVSESRGSRALYQSWGALLQKACLGTFQGGHVCFQATKELRAGARKLRPHQGEEPLGAEQDGLCLCSCHPRGFQANEIPTATLGGPSYPVASILPNPSPSLSISLSLQKKSEPGSLKSKVGKYKMPQG